MSKTNEPAVTRRKVSEFTPDPANANLGTERGLRILDDSLAEVGAGRSIVTDKNGIILAGNKTAERSLDRGIEDALVVHTRGDQLVVVQRDDLDLHDPNPDNPARKLAYYDNVTSQHMAWDANRIAADVAAGVNLEKMFYDWELDTLAGNVIEDQDPRALWQGMPEFEQEDLSPYRTIMVHFTCEADVEAFKKLTGQVITEKTKYIYFPALQKEDLKPYRVEDES